MNGLDNLIAVFDSMLDTKRKRHITGGILLSISMLFGDLALTAMTARYEGNDISDDVKEEIDDGQEYA